MIIDPETVDRIKQAVAEAMATGGCATTLIAITLNAIDEAIADPLDPTPFAVGRRVKHAMFDRVGVVVRRIESRGELHTVTVRWDDWVDEVAHGPRELVEL